MIRRWSLVALILAAVIAPNSARAARPPLVKFAHGSADMKDFFVRGAAEQFVLTGSFRLGKDKYKGVVTGDWGYDALTGFSSKFSGSDGGHTFTATCDFTTPVAGSLEPFAPVGFSPPTAVPSTESLFCKASIDGSAPSGLVLNFLWLTFAPGSCGSYCYYNEYTGYFVGI